MRKPIEAGEWRPLEEMAAAGVWDGADESDRPGGSV
jgi:hypothetical protein